MATTIHKDGLFIEDAAPVGLSTLTTSTSEHSITNEEAINAKEGEPIGRNSVEETTTTSDKDARTDDLDRIDQDQSSPTFTSRRRRRARPTSSTVRGRRRLALSVSSVCKRSRLVSPPRSDADVDAHPFRQQHPGWPALKDLPEACWTHHHFRKPSEFAQIVDQDPRPAILLATKIYPQRHICKALAHAETYEPGENSEIFHGALKADLRDHLRSEFARAGSFEYRKIAGYEEVILCMAEIYWILFGHWPLHLQREYLYSLPTWLTLMVPCYYEWRNASCRWAPKSKMPQAPSAKRFLTQYPAAAQPRWTLGRPQECALFMNPNELSELHMTLPIFRLLLHLRQSLSPTLQPPPEVSEAPCFEAIARADNDLPILPYQEEEIATPDVVFSPHLEKLRNALLSLKDMTSTVLGLVSHCIACLPRELLILDPFKQFNLCS